MDWHIITGSKGGVGKTLLALLLSGHYLDGNGSTLVIDLNSMNADFSRLLFYQKEVGEPIAIAIPTQERKNEQIVLQKTFSLNEKRNPYYYGVGWPLNPFKTYDPSLFAKLLVTLKNSATTVIEEKLDIPPIETVIIDTNYHFCNIFSEQDIYYSEYTEGPLVGESITIWFMWVYRQLENLIRLKYNDATVMKLTAAAIERNIKSNSCRKSPFMHVFGPATLISSKPQEEERSIGSFIARKIYQAITQNKDVHIEELEELESLPVGSGISFSDWLKKLEIAHIAAEKDGDPRHHFLDILIKATRTPSRENPSIEERPINVVPMSVYHNDLQYYTDGNYRDVIAELRNFDIYENFSKLIKR
ncbi:hypothetical protein [Candidatus Parabeggiatoa sp. HSG14]|uniref:hypothetical protein n=1 Tax=Candidatus Parabeggiatoa sp. HSG14 TaxID=3055593 RepID=UPI0025A81761|nr:hypothetical protein [Thiotrichales bacterium HSG14]